MNDKPFATTELNPLPDAVQELTIERDAYAKAADEMAASHKVERDAYIVEAARFNTGWRKANEAALETNLKNAALKDAARLALDVIDNMAHFEHEDDPEKPISEAIAALKAVL